MKVGICYNEKQVEHATAEKLARAIQAAGSEAVVFSRIEDVADIDRLIALGGDGTVLRGARRASELGIPIFGVNYGHIGFLTEFERGEMGQAAALALEENCARIERSMLEVELNGVCTVCLNECALLRRVSPEEENRVVRIAVQIDGSSTGEMTADGLIVSTPTGSTAYSLSAGGSIMTPDCRAFMLTPICAFSMRSRPIVYSSESELAFSMRTGDSLLLYGDGKFLGEVKGDDVLKVRKAARHVTFLTNNKKSYFRRLTEKIN